MTNKIAITSLILFSLISLAYSDTATLTSQNGQVVSYVINITKNSTNVGIYSFLLANSLNQTVSSVSQNCTITDTISCNATFIIQNGIWNRLLILSDGVLISQLNLTIPVNYASAVQTPKEFITISPLNAVYIIIGILGVLIGGNVIYYFKKKGE